MSRLVGSEGTRESLDKWLTYLDGDPNRCKCDYSWKGQGRFNGIDMGKGWSRMTTHPSCPIHALCQGYTAASEAAYRKTHPWATTGRWCPVHKNKGCPEQSRGKAKPVKVGQSDEKAVVQ